MIQNQIATEERTKKKVKSSERQMQLEKVVLNTDQRDDLKQVSQTLAEAVQMDIVIAKVITDQSVTDAADISLLPGEVDLNFKRAWPYKQ